MNKVILIGRLTRDPEIRVFTNGGTIANFTVAVNRNFKNREGGYDADFIPVQVNGMTVNYVQRYVTKGSQVCVEGRMQVRSYDHQDGSKRFITEVIADRVDLLGSRSNNNEMSSPVNAYVDSTSEIYRDEPSREDGVDISNNDSFNNFGEETSLSDDDLPF